MDLKLKGKVALVTGGARGQGRAHCVALAREGADIVTCDLGKPVPDMDWSVGTIEEIAETVKQVEGLGRRAMGLTADVSKENEVKAMVDAAISTFGKVDILVNNAGVCFLSEPVQQTKESDWSKTIDMNLKGSWLCCKYVVPRMIDRQYGKIINISSIAGLTGFANTSPYICSKHGVMGLTVALAVELAPYKINVNTICPGPIDTPMFYESIKKTGQTLEEGEKGWLASTVFNKLIPPEEVSNAVLWFASDVSRFVTGQYISVSGGWVGIVP
jgi:NAD(P)-dependent dehydrogenase (short-subunit alcohol dehydrogenase family)